MRHTRAGPAVTYRKELWLVRDGCIDLDGGPYEEAEEPAPDQPSLLGDEDTGQQGLIELPPEARVLVDAGPGTGKTYVACARVASIIDAGLPASRIWLISFTRTAVVEIRNRIAGALQDPAEAASVRVATLDSHAWALHSGFSSEATLTGSFDDNIERTLERVQTDEDLQDYLGRVRHLVIDEGQDIVGVRAELALALIDALDPDCGVTVFADEAQAIYGFTEDERGPVAPLSLPEELRRRGFRQLFLDRVHRTRHPGLVEIFTRVRRRVLRRIGSAADRLRQISDEIRRLADEALDADSDIRIDALSADSLVLMRRRADVLELSSRAANTPHRLRMSGLPACVRPWIALLLWDHTDHRLSRTRFEALWGERMNGQAAPDGDTAWRLLVEVAGESAATVDLRRLRATLGRAAPPMIFCTPEFGEAGPVLGTIHASKGREADEVVLCVPALGDAGDLDLDEEIRVLFVGATRARSRLTIAAAGYGRAGSASGRAWRWMRPPAGRPRLRRLKVEVGRAQDLSPEGLVGRRAFAEAGEAAAVQAMWASAPAQSRLVARSVREFDYDYVLERDAERLALLSPGFSSDLREIANQTSRWPPPGFLPHIRSIGARTMAVPPDHPALETLHEPWRSSGFLLAPLITGFSPGSFREER